MNKFIKNERGNGLILTIFNFAVVGIMLILIVNLILVFTKKEQASNAAEQASFAATAVVYEEVNKVVESYVKIIGIDEEGIEILKPLREIVEEKEREIRSTEQGLSNNETHIMAVNNVLMEEIDNEPLLKAQILSALDSAKSKIPTVVKETIGKNHGKESPSDYQYYLNEDYRIEVIAATEFEVVNHNGVTFGSNQDIVQKGSGPVMEFVTKVGWSL